MTKLDYILERAYKSSFWLGILNIAMFYTIPFNAPHRFRIKFLSKNKILIKIPYIRKNLNHLKGIHACALATASEYACGFLLISNLSPSKYRLIMRSMHVDFVKQGKGNLFVEFSLDDEILEKIRTELEEKGQELYTYKVECRNEKGELISIATLEWQLKNWKLLKN